jgi:multiple sugar transport system substrate-binding protein
MNRMGWLSALAVLCMISAGCSKQGTEIPAEQSQEPITLTVFPQVGISKEQFETFFAGPVHKKYPYITMQLIDRTAQTTLENLVAAGNYPDIVLAGYQYVSTLKQLNMLANLNEYVKKYKLDINRYEQEPIRTIKSIAGADALPGLPYSLNFAVNYYNKDIFDKFGVKYPKDGMNWDETIELSRSLTRQEGGVNYRGLVPGVSPERISAATGLGYIDAKTNKATINNDGWKQIFNLYVTVYNIPNYGSGTNGKDAFSKGKDAFLKDKTLAMYTEWSDVLTDIGTMDSRGEKFNWDMVTLPNFKEHLGQGRNSGAHTLFVSSSSKYKEQAYLAVSHIADSEVQDIVNQSGKLSSLKKTTEMKNTFGTNLSYLKGKNVGAIFGVTVSDLAPPTDYDPALRALINNTVLMQSVTELGKDLNTALRETEESANKLIEQQKQAQK